MQLQPGAPILNGKFRIVRRLGGGASAEVYEATQVELDAPRALKILSRDMPGVGSMEVTQFAARFVYEGRLQTRLKGHPRIVEVYDTDTLDGAPVLIMEYCAGGSLQDELGAIAKLRLEIDVTRVSEVLLDIADGLAGLHRLNCVHRDLKPSNVLLDGARRAKISDLGLAQAEDAPDVDRSDGRANAHPGTPPYMSPEHAFRQAYLTPAADIYALGVIGYRMLAGRFPEGPDPLQRPKDARPGVPGWLDTLVIAMLHHDPRERPHDGSVVAAALRDGMTADAERAARVAELMKRKVFSRRVALVGAVGIGSMGLAWLATQVVGGPLPATLMPAPTWIPPTEMPASTTSRPLPTSAPPVTNSPQPSTAMPNPALRRIGLDRVILTLAPSAEMEFVRVPAGEFIMGSDLTKDNAANDNEVPQHKLSLAEYWIGRTEVTAAQFAAYVTATGTITSAIMDMTNKSSHPVRNVSWLDCIQFCGWASKLAGGEVALPSEAEWEKAARGTDGRLYPWGNGEPDDTRLNYNLTVKDTSPVGKYGLKGLSPYGCDDMAGNVWEWTRSLLWAYPYAPNDGREDHSSREVSVWRGGTSIHNAYGVRCAARYGPDPRDLIHNVGFRVIIRLPSFG